MTDIIHGIKQQLSSFSEEVKTYPCYAQIKEHMAEATKRIGYSFRDHSLLMLAFCREKIGCEDAGKNNATYKNDTLAQIGDAVLDLTVVEWGFSVGKVKGAIDEKRQEYANNERLSSIVDSKELKQFCYHKNYFYKNAPNHEKVSAGSHDSIVEAIIGAIYLDGGLGKAREWIMKNIFTKN